MNSNAIPYPDNYEPGFTVKRGNVYSYGGTLYIAYGDQSRFSENFFETPKSTGWDWLFATPTGKVFTIADQVDGHKITDVNKGDLYKTEAGKWYIYAATEHVTNIDTPSYDPNIGGWVEINMSQWKK